MSELTREQKMDAARARMAELAAKFLDRTEGDIASMRESLGRLGSGETAALGDIRHLAHRMVGTGATLGFESLSERAHRIEMLAESCPPGAPPDQSLRERLTEALDALDTEFRRQRSS